MKWRPYPAYKDSGIEWLGEIPAHWEMKRLKFIADVQSGVAKGRNLEGRETIDLPYLRVANVQRGYVDLSDVATITIGKDEVSRYSLQKGDILMTEGGDYDKLGRGAVWEGPVSPCVHQNHIFAVRAHQDRNPYWISTITQANYARHYFILHSKQSTNLASISSTNIMELPVVLPPFEQQESILSFLDRKTAHIDALIAKKERQIELLQEKRAALISHAVTKGLDPDTPMKDSGVEWLGEIPAHWRTGELRRLAKPGTSITYGIVQAGPDVEDGIPYIRTGDMKGNHLPKTGYLRTSPEIDRAYRRSRVYEGDIVVAIRATVGKALPVPSYLNGANLTQGTAKVSPGDKLNGRFLLYAIQSDGTQQRFEQLAKGATFREITLDMLRRLAITIPPLTEQNAIVEFLNHKTKVLNVLEKTARKSIITLHEYRTALISAAVTGKIDVRDEQVQRI